MFTKYRARPHWAKNHFLNFNKVDKLYPELYKWKRVYLLFNSDGTFDNEFTSKVGFEDLRDSECSGERTQSNRSAPATYSKVPERRCCSQQEEPLHRASIDTVTQQPMSSNTPAQQQPHHHQHDHVDCPNSHDHRSSEGATVTMMTPDDEVISSQPINSAGVLPRDPLTAEKSSPPSLRSADGVISTELTDDSATDVRPQEDGVGDQRH